MNFLVENIGIDIEEISEIKKSLNNPKFKKMIFSNEEITYCEKKKNPEISFAGKFCAKEAVKKALSENVPIKKIEILNQKSGKPFVKIEGKVIKNILCSISHTKSHAISFVVVKKV